MELTKDKVVENLNRIKLDLFERGVSQISWMGVNVRWERLPKSKGGLEKRKGIFGKYIYEYMGEEITLGRAIDEILMPANLRQVLIEAESIIQCVNCGKVLTGKDAIEANDFYIIRDSKRCWNKRWGRLSYFNNGENKWFDICWECGGKISGREGK